MKLKVALAFFFLYSAICFSQTKKPEFEFTLYGEDSRGHKDSVIIGFDHNAIAFSVDTSFGDKNITNTKFDSVFEMRVHKLTYAGAYNDSYPFLLQSGTSKHITLSYRNQQNEPGCVPYGVSGYGFILMKVKYPPVKLSWDKNVFEKSNANYCIGMSYLVDNEYVTQELTPEQYPFTVYMYKTSVLVDSLIYYPQPHNVGPHYTLQNIKLIYPDGSKDSLQSNYQFRFKNSGLGSPTENLAQTINKVYPNPCREQLNIFLPDIKRGAFTVNIYGINGILMSVAHKYANDIISVETSSLNTGNYIVEVVTNDNKRFIAKFDKVQ